MLFSTQREQTVGSAEFLFPWDCPCRRYPHELVVNMAVGGLVPVWLALLPETTLLEYTGFVFGQCCDSCFSECRLELRPLRLSSAFFRCTLRADLFLLARLVLIPEIIPSAHLLHSVASTWPQAFSTQKLVPGQRWQS